MQYHTSQKGITLLITLLLMGVLLGISTALLNITLKQFQLSGISYDSEVAFQSASAGMECALYSDFVQDTFALGVTDPQASCFGSNATWTGTVTSGDEQIFEFDWGSDPAICTIVSVHKFYEDPADDGDTDGPDVTIDGVPMRDKNDPDENQCPEGSVCTVVQSRGYNVSCANITSGRGVVEREYTQVY